MHTLNKSADPVHHEALLPAGSAKQMPADALDRFDAFMRRETLLVAHDWMQVDNFKARIEALSPELIMRLHELTVGVFWPHRYDDLMILLEMGAGYLALDEIDRAVSTTMSFPSGDDFAMLGMMVTTPRLQAQGTGGRLLRRVMADAKGRDMRLSATRDGYHLYESAGFVPDGLIYQHQGIARAIREPSPLPGVTLRTMEPRDADAVAEMDAHAYGARRTRILEVLGPRSDASVAERDGAVIGYAYCRPFGRGRVIGPCVTEDEAVAIRLAAHFVTAHTGTFLRFDLHQENERIAAFLSAAGMGMFDTVTEMHLGRARRARSGPIVQAMALQSLG